MPESPLGPHLATPAELKERLELEELDVPFLVFRDGEGTQRLVTLAEDAGDLTIGRHRSSDVRLDWDLRVSGLHAELRRVGGHWLVVDDGLSRNGTFVNESRVVGRRRLHDGDLVRAGKTVIAFRDPGADARRRTAPPTRTGHHPQLSPAQMRVLVTLCRPFAGGDAFARPATNQQIADELHLSVAAVKTHLRNLFGAFGLEDLAHNEKRTRLARLALALGVVSPSDVGRPGPPG